MKRDAASGLLRRNARTILIALARSPDDDHRALARQLAPLIGASLDRLDPLPPIPRGGRFGSR